MQGRARWAVVGLFGLACGGGGGEKAGQSGTSGPEPEGSTETPADDYVRYELDFRDDAVVVDDLAGVQRALVRADYALGEFVFQSDFEGLAGLDVGSAAVLAGVGVFRILGRESTAEGELVRVEEAPLTDVLDNASIAWRKSFVSAYTGDRIGLGLDEDERDSIGKERAAESSFLDGKLHYEGQSGKFSSVFDLAPGEDGLDYAVTTKFGGSVGSMTAAMNGTLRGMTQEVDLEIIGSVVTQYEELYYDVAGNVNFQVGAAKAEGEVKIGFPARLSLPFSIGPLPFRIDLGSSIEIATTLQADSSAEYAGSVKFAGDAGVRFKDGGVEYIANFDTTDLTLTDSTQTSSVTAGVSTLLNFPELSVGVGVPKLAEGIAFLRFKSEAITNGTIVLDANGEADGLCIEAGANFGATYGGEAKFLGVKVLSAEKDLYGKIGAKRRSPDCED